MCLLHQQERQGSGRVESPPEGTGPAGHSALTVLTWGPGQGKLHVHQDPNWCPLSVTLHHRSDPSAGVAGSVLDPHLHRGGEGTGEQKGGKTTGFHTLLAKPTPARQGQHNVFRGPCSIRCSVPWGTVWLSVTGMVTGDNAFDVLPKIRIKLS